MIRRNRVKKYLLGISLVLTLILTGCQKPEVVETITESKAFLTHQDISYDVKEYVMSNNMHVDVIEGFYMPEVNHVCFNIRFEGYDSDAYYAVHFKHEAPKLHSIWTYDGISIDSDNKATICHQEIEYESYEIEIVTTNQNGQTDYVLTKINYEDMEYNTTSVLEASLIPYEQDSVELYGNPYIKFDIEIDGLTNYPNAQFKAKPYNIVSNDILTSEDFTYTDDRGFLNGYIIENLTPNMTYGIELLYQPLKNHNFNIRIAYDRVRSSLMLEIDNACHTKFACADIINYEIIDDNILFDIYVLLDEAKINPVTNAPYELYFNIYDDKSDVVFKQQLFNDDRTINVATSIIPQNGKIEVQSDITVSDQLFDVFGTDYMILDYVNIIDGEIRLNE